MSKCNVKNKIEHESNKRNYAKKKKRKKAKKMGAQAGNIQWVLMSIAWPKFTERFSNFKIRGEKKTVK